MKHILTFLVVLSAGFSQAQSLYSDSIRKTREDHDSTFFTTVLNNVERGNMLSLCYFKPDESYIVKAEFTRMRGKKFIMPMTKARKKPTYYRQYGKLTFTLNDTVCELFVYENLDLKEKEGFEDYLFMPFRDRTSGDLTYGGGRFIDLSKPKQGNWVIDFNTAYNPYCAYSERYSCPLTPKENTLKMGVYAGTCYYQHD